MVAVDGAPHAPGTDVVLRKRRRRRHRQPTPSIYSQLDREFRELDIEDAEEAKCFIITVTAGLLGAVVVMMFAIYMDIHI